MKYVCFRFQLWKSSVWSVGIIILFYQNILYRNCIFHYIFCHFSAFLTIFVLALWHLIWRNKNFAKIDLAPALGTIRPFNLINLGVLSSGDNAWTPAESHCRRKIRSVTGALNAGRAHRVIVRAERTITIQVMSFAAAEKRTLMLGSTKLWQSLERAWRSRATGHSACWKDAERTITVQDYRSCRQIDFNTRVDIKLWHSLEREI